MALYNVYTTTEYIELDALQSRKGSQLLSHYALLASLNDTYKTPFLLYFYELSLSTETLIVKVGSQGQFLMITVTSH